MNTHTDSQYDGVGPQKHKPKKRRYTILTKSDLQQLPFICWKVKHVLPESGLALFYGRSGVGKSFLLLDLACAIASGRPWFGRKTKPSPVIYVCLEGAAGIASRMKAWELGHTREFPENVYVIDGHFNFLDTDNVVSLINDVKALCDKLPQDLGSPVVIVDTLNRAMVGGDENGSKDMSMVWNACGYIVKLTRGLVILTHHCGKDAERGPRGHSSAIPTVDASIIVSRSKGQHTWQAEKVKDGPDNRTWRFSLDTAVLGQDEDGDDITSCFITAGDEVVTADIAKPAALNANQVLGMKILRSLAKSGDAVKESEWRRQFIAQVNAQSDSGKRNAFNRIKRELSEQNLIVLDEVLATVSEIS